MTKTPIENPFEWVVREALSRTGANQGYVALLQADRFRIHHSLGDEKQRFRILTVSEGVAGFVVRTNEAYFCADPTLDPHYVGSSPRVRHEVAVPLREPDGTPIGVLLVDSFNRRTFDSKTIPTLQSLAEDFVRSWRGVTIGSGVDTVGVLAPQSLSERIVALAHETVRAALERVGGDQAFLALCDNFRLHIVHSVGDEKDRFVSLPIDQGIAGRAITLQESQTWRATQKDPYYVQSSDRVVEEIVAPLLMASGVGGVLLVDSFEEGILGEHSLTELEDFARSFAFDYEYDSSPDKIKAKLRFLLMRHFAPPELRPLVDGDVPLDLKMRPVTVLFADVRNFSELAVRIQPELVGDFIVEYYGEMKAAIHNHGGALDKYIGDGVMGLFGFPGANAQQAALQGVDAALEMQALFQDLKARFSRRVEKTLGLNMERLSLGCALHSGDALVGFPKGAHFLDLTAIGVTVNVAARLEKSFKQHAIRISSVTKGYVEDRFDTEFLGNQAIDTQEYLVYAVSSRRT